MRPINCFSAIYFVALTSIGAIAQPAAERMEALQYAVDSMRCHVTHDSLRLSLFMIQLAGKVPAKEVLTSHSTAATKIKAELTATRQLYDSIMRLHPRVESAVPGAKPTSPPSYVTRGAEDDENDSLQKQTETLTREINNLLETRGKLKEAANDAGEAFIRQDSIDRIITTLINPELDKILSDVYFNDSVLALIKHYSEASAPLQEIPTVVIRRRETRIRAAADFIKEISSYLAKPYSQSGRRDAIASYYQLIEQNWFNKAQEEELAYWPDIINDYCTLTNGAAGLIDATRLGAAPTKAKCAELAKKLGKLRGYYPRKHLVIKAWIDALNHPGTDLLGLPSINQTDCAL